MKLTFLSLFVVFAGLAGTAPAQGGAVEVKLLRGDIVSGEWRALANGNLTIEPEGGQAVSVPVADCISLQFKRNDAQALADRKHSFFATVTLAAGDLVSGVVSGGDGEKLQLSVSGQVIPIPIDAIRKITFPARVPPQVLDFAANPSGDRLYQLHKSDDRLDPTIEPINGTLSSFDEKSLKFEGVLGSTSYPYENLAAILLTPLGGKPSAKGAPSDALVTLVPDGKLKVKIVNLTAGGLQVESESLGKCTIPIRSIGSIRFRSALFTDLSELEPSSVEETAYFGGGSSVRYPWKRDRTVTGGALRVGGVLYESGLGVHSRSLLTFPLDGNFVSFRTKAGVDDETLALPRKGSVIFRIHVDDKKVYESPVVRSGERAVEPPAVDLRGAKKLTLEVDFADGFDIADRADWCEPILLKSGGESRPAK